jgi:hypothetical protein
LIGINKGPVCVMWPQALVYIASPSVSVAMQPSCPLPFLCVHFLVSRLTAPTSRSEQVHWLLVLAVEINAAPLRADQIVSLCFGLCPSCVSSEDHTASHKIAGVKLGYLGKGAAVSRTCLNAQPLLALRLESSVKYLMDGNLRKSLDTSGLTKCPSWPGSRTYS